MSLALAGGEPKLLMSNGLQALPLSEVPSGEDKYGFPREARESGEAGREYDTNFPRTLI